MSIATQLAGFGFPKEHIHLYLTLLESGPTTLAELARAGQIHRATVYRLLPILQQRGFVTEVQRGRRRVYSAADPLVLKRLADEQAHFLGELIPQLQQLAERKKGKPEFRVHSGESAIRGMFDVFMERLKKDEVYYRFSSRRTTTPYDQYHSTRYRELRSRKKPEHFVITSESNAKTYESKLERAVKTIPNANLAFEHDINAILFQDTTLFVDYRSDTALEINSRAFTDFIKHIFKSLYDRL